MPGWLFDSVALIDWFCGRSGIVIAQQAGRLRQQVGLNRLSLPDAAIATTAQLTGHILLTRNTRDFFPLRHLLAVELYAKD